MMPWWEHHQWLIWKMISLHWPHPENQLNQNICNTIVTPLTLISFSLLMFTLEKIHKYSFNHWKEDEKLIMSLVFKPNEIISNLSLWVFTHRSTILVIEFLSKMESQKLWRPIFVNIFKHDTIIVINYNNQIISNVCFLKSVCFVWMKWNKRQPFLYKWRKRMYNSILQLNDFYTEINHLIIIYQIIIEMLWIC